MRILRIITIVLATLAIGAVITALSLSSKWQVEVSQQIKSPPEKIFPMINSLNKWPDWSVWNRANHPNLTMTYEGEPAGKGAIQNWQEGKEKGRLKITASDANQRIAYRLNMGNTVFLMHGEISFAPTSSGTQVTWKVRGDTGPNLIARLMMMAFKPMIKKDLSDGLARLKIIMEKPGA